MKRKIRKSAKKVYFKDLEIKTLKQYPITKLNGLISEITNKEDLEENSFKREKLENERLKREIKKLKERPWIGKGSNEIIKENKELKKINKDLKIKINKTLEEIEKIY